MKPRPQIFAWSALVGAVATVWFALGWVGGNLSSGSAEAPDTDPLANPSAALTAPDASPTAADLFAKAANAGSNAEIPRPSARKLPAAIVEKARQNVADFEDWWTERKSHPSSPMTAADWAVVEGRRSGMKVLIQADADLALSHMLSLSEYLDLPAEVRPRIEIPVAKLASVDVLPWCPEPGLSAEELARLLEENPAVRYRAVVDSTALEIYPSAQREGFLSKTMLPIFGIQVDEVVALHSSPVRLLQPNEESAAKALFNPEEVVIGDADTVALSRKVLVGDQMVSLPTAEAYLAWEELLREAESLPGPDLVDEALRLLLAPEDAPTELEASRTALRLASSSWTETPKRMLFIRVDFPDRPGGPAPLQTWQTNTAEAAGLFTNWSYGKTTIVPTITSQIYRLQQSSQYVDGENIYLLLQHAKTAAAADYTLANYDIHVICFARIFSSGWAGKASVGGPNQWLNGYEWTGLIVHETGHNYGLWHANWWQADANENAASVRGQHREYGDPFDEMGGTGEFNMRFKNRLNWLENQNTIRVQQSGTYRIYRFDTPGARGNDGMRPLALAISSQTGNLSTHSYWVGFRRAPAPGLPSPTGAYVLWDPNPTGNAGTRLLDMTRNTPNEARDAFLEINRTFTDPTGLIQITPLQRGGSGADEWMDISVGMGVSGNRPPSVTLESPLTAEARSPLTFTARATDPDGDRLVYMWNFGEGEETPGGPNMSYRYVAGGNFNVSVTVSDLRGGDVTETKQIDVKDPVQPWTNHTVLPGQSIRSLAWWQNSYFAIASNHLYRSGDGMTWERVALPAEATFPFQKISASPFGLVLVGRAFNTATNSWGGAVAESSDGENWVRVAVPSGTRDLHSVAFGNLMWVAVGRQGQILTKRRGQDWQNSSFNSSSDLRDVAFGGGQFLIVGTASTALRGHGGGTWTPIPGLPEQRTFTSVANSAHLWAIGGNGVLLTSKNGGVTWQSAMPLTPWRSVDALAFSGGMLFASTFHFEHNLTTNTSVLRREHLFWLEEGRTGFTLDASPAKKSSALYAGGRLLLGTDEGQVIRSNHFRPPPSLISGPATPSVRVLSHKARQRIFEPSITLSGSLTARGELPSLQISTDGGVTWRAAIVYGESSPFSWLIDLDLEEGDNFLRLIATDENGRKSATLQLPVRYVVPASLSVQPMGDGRVPAPFLGTTIRDRGVAYTITARPLRGMIFREWLLNGESISRQSRLTFVLREDSELTPVFLPNPFPEADGHFSGLFGDGDISDNISPAQFALQNGFVSAFVSPAGNFSGQILWAGQRLPLRGKLDGFGEAQLTIPRRGLSSITVRLQLALEGPPVLSGVLERDGEAYSFTLGRALRTGRGITHPLGGAAFSFQQDTAPEEGAASPLILLVRPNGMALFSGVLPDATRIRAQGHLLPENDGWNFPLAVALAARTPGLLWGEIAVAQPDPDPIHEIAWARWPSRRSPDEFLRTLTLLPLQE
jgi:photosystem II stability/assembly factor-like uncharacterized protein